MISYAVPSGYGGVQSPQFPPTTAFVMQGPPMPPPPLPPQMTGLAASVTYAGGVAWQEEKLALQRWLKSAFANPRGSEYRELFGFLAGCFLDADKNKDGQISDDEFDALIERGDSLLRRFGLSEEMKELGRNAKGKRFQQFCDFCEKQKSEKQKSEKKDGEQKDGEKKAGETGIGLDDWIPYMMDMYKQKTEAMQDPPVLVEFRGVGHPYFYCTYLKKVMQDPNSEEFKSLYGFIFKIFLECDMDGQGAIPRQQLDVLIEGAMQVEKKVGLDNLGCEPLPLQSFRSEDEKTAARDELWKTICGEEDAKSMKFQKFLEWALACKAEIADTAWRGMREQYQ